jgi:hypothetical protein
MSRRICSISGVMTLTNEGMDYSGRHRAETVREPRFERKQLLEVSKYTAYGVATPSHYALYG